MTHQRRFFYLRTKEPFYRYVCAPQGVCPTLSGEAWFVGAGHAGDKGLYLQTPHLHIFR